MRASSGSVPRVHGDPNHQERTETPTAADPGPKDLSRPDSPPGARCVSSQLPVRPPQPRTDRQTDGQGSSLSPLSPTEPPRIPPGPFPSGALLMSARGRRRIPSPLRLINLITPLQITGDAKPEGRRSVGAPLTPRNGFPPLCWDPKAPTLGSQGGQGHCQPQDGTGGAPQPPRCPRHASTGSPWGTSAPRPQTDPMKTIMAPVEGNQARHSAMRPAGPGERCPTAPGPL